MGIQSKNGKAFEYVCLMSLNNAIKETTKTTILENSAFKIAEEAFNITSEKLQNIMSRAANSSVKILFNLEPTLYNIQRDDILKLSLQDDCRGIHGDVRDILISLQNSTVNWETGVSIKHNHSAVKHSRLSQTIDFGKSWFGYNCSDEYFKEITPIFDRLKILKSENIKWKELKDKEEAVYVKLLNAFVNEIKRLDTKYPKEIPKLLMSYLLGKLDFYKLISNDSKKTTQIQAFSLYGTLNKSSFGVKPKVKIPTLKLPTKIYEIEYKEKSKNTILIVLNEGFSISLRIHNASTYVEPSLKFDIKLIGVPPDLYTHTETWD